MTTSRSRRGATGEKAAKPMTAVQDSVSTSVSMDDFKENLRFFPAMFVVTKTGTLSPNMIFNWTLRAALSQYKTEHKPTTLGHKHFMMESPVDQIETA